MVVAEGTTLLKCTGHGNLGDLDQHSNRSLDFFSSITPLHEFHESVIVTLRRCCYPNATTHRPVSPNAW